MTGDVGVRDAPARPLSAATASFTSLGLYAGRIAGSVVGRPREIAAVQRAIANARQRMTCLVLEGEPGIGKTRVLLAAEELARAEEFRSIAVTADEEISGPFMVARSIFGSPALWELAADSPAAESVQRAVGALSNRDDPAFESIAPDARLLRVYDVAAIALRTLAADRPLMLAVDDLQWADEDSLRLLRYVVRTSAQSPILIALGTRPNETAFVNEAVTLLADMDRMGVLERLKLTRFTLVESTELLQQLLGGRIDPASAAVMHAQAEGVPFILGEQAHTYRDAGLIQQIDGVWSLARNAERLLPNAVRTLIQRRASRLPEHTQAVLAEAAVLGRSFSLRDLHDVKAKLDGGTQDAAALAESLAPAVAVGLLVPHPDGAAADYSFSHEGVREFAAATLQAPRRRAIHGAIVDLLIQDGDPPTESLPLVARHALAAGRNELCVRTALEAARTALAANAPDEVLRLVEMVQPITAGAQNRVALLCLRDDALGMLRRSTQRLEGLTELAALAEAMGDAHLELGVMLRRAAALRLSGEYEAATDVAQRVRELASEQGDAPAELAACLELGQDLLRTDMGEGLAQTPTEGDLHGAHEAYTRALAIAQAAGDEASEAAALRELGVIASSRVRVWFVEQVAAGEIPGVVRMLLDGASLHDDILPTTPIASDAEEAKTRFQQAMDIYERLGDRRGVMSTIIAMAVIAWAPGIHLSGSPRHIEEIRRLTTRVKSFTRESERALADAQMLFGVHVYSRSRGFPDVALVKGEAAWNAARTMGDRGLEFAAAGGVALQHAELAAHDEAARWLSRAAAVAAEAPTPLRALQLQTWRGILAAAAGDAPRTRQHLEQALEVATQQGKAAARCEVLALLALETARLGTSYGDEQLLAIAERSATDAQALAAVLPGHAPWAAQADAALARVALARRDEHAAAASGRLALDTFDRAVREDLHLEIVLPAAEALLVGGTETERTAIRDRLQLTAALIAQRILDESVRVRWFGAPLGRELMRLAGPLDPARAVATSTKESPLLTADEGILLRALTEARTNAEMAEQLGVSVDVVAQRLATLFAKLGVSSRGDATTAALTGNLV